MEDVFYPQNNGDISSSITQSWTEQAIECYSIKCDCSQCSLKNGHYSFKCQMKHIVEILLKTRGIPNDAEILNVQDDIVA